MSSAVSAISPRADTPRFTTETCEFRDTVDVFAETEIAVIGISDDPVSDLNAFATEYNLSFPLLSGDGTVGSVYDSCVKNNMFLTASMAYFEIHTLSTRWERLHLRMRVFHLRPTRIDYLRFDATGVVY